MRAPRYGQAQEYKQDEEEYNHGPRSSGGLGHLVGCQWWDGGGEGQGWV